MTRNRNNILILLNRILITIQYVEKMLINKKEKEKRIIELYNQGKTIREIAKEVHMSFKDISSTIKRYTGEEHEDKSRISLSKDTQAIKMFSQNKTPIDVTTELNLKVNQVEKIYKNYWKLKRLYKLYNLYEEHIKNDIPSFLKLYKIIKEAALDEKNIRTIIIYAFQLQSLDELVQERKDELKFLVNQNNTLNSKIKELEVKLKQLNNIYIRNQSEVDRLNNVIKSKSTYLNTLENSINDLINGEDYPGILEIVQQKVTSILNSKENLLIASIVTVLYILRNHPNKAILIIDPEYYDYEMCITTNSEDFLKDSSFKKYIKTHYKPILDIANILYKKILKQVQNDILFSSPKNIPYNDVSKMNPGITEA